MKRREALGVVCSIGAATAVSGCLGLGGSEPCGPGEIEIQTVADNYGSFRGNKVSLQGEGGGGCELESGGGCLEVFELDDGTGTATVYMQETRLEIPRCVAVRGVVGPKDKIADPTNGPEADIAVLDAVVIGVN